MNIAIKKLFDTYLELIDNDKKFIKDSDPYSLKWLEYLERYKRLFIELKKDLSALPSLKEQVDKLQRYWFDHDWYDKNEKWDWLRYDDLLDLLNEPK
jgi:hypothetical protein